MLWQINQKTLVRRQAKRFSQSHTIIIWRNWQITWTDNPFENLQRLANARKIHESGTFDKDNLEN